jgi:dephospho-CoA kinase
LIDRRKLDAITAENLLKAQLPLNVKVNKADSVVWNDGSQTMLEAQALMILSDLTKF